MKRFVPMVLAMAMMASQALAQVQPVRVELNKLEPRDASCRAFLVVENASATAFETLRLDLAIFDTDGIVARRLAVETAPLPTDKTSLRVFDIDGMACARIGRILLNDVISCADMVGLRQDCLPLLRPESRAPAPFIK